MRVPEHFRKQLFKRLLGPIERIPPGHTARVLLEQVAAHQLEDIEPTIEKLLDWARRQGKQKAKRKY